MPVHNADIAAVFEEIANLLEIEGANVFRVRAYRNAARTLQELGRDVQAMLQEGEDLTELPGIGNDLAAKIREMVETGRCAALDKLHKQLPPAITELLKIQGLGPKRVKTLYHELDIHTVEQLQRAVCDHRIRELPGPIVSSKHGGTSQTPPTWGLSVRRKNGNKLTYLIPLFSRLSLWVGNFVWVPMIPMTLDAANT